MSARPPATFGQYMRQQRELARLSLREMARMTNVSNAYLSQIERGLHAPSLRVMQAVAKALDVPVEELVSLTPGASRQWRSERETDDGAGVEAAIRREDRLSPDQKAALITVFRSYLQAGNE
jgi:transcriptional regulator with XRE-family HTH domain